jgi:hypothetical protein
MGNHKVERREHTSSRVLCAKSPKARCGLYRLVRHPPHLDVQGRHRGCMAADGGDSRTGPREINWSLRVSDFCIGGLNGAQESAYAVQIRSRRGQRGVGVVYRGTCSQHDHAQPEHVARHVPVARPHVAAGYRPRRILLSQAALGSGWQPGDRQRGGGPGSQEGSQRRASLAEMVSCEGVSDDASPGAPVLMCRSQCCCVHLVDLERPCKTVPACWRRGIDG